MRIPRTPPALDDLLSMGTTDLSSILTKMKTNLGVTDDRQYLHWDQIRHRRPPAGLSHEEWWMILKLSRHLQFREAPLKDAKGAPFRYTLADPILERLHQTDRQVAGRVEMPESITNVETKDRYLFHSLVEEAITSSQLEGAATTRRVAKDMIRRNRPPVDRGERMILNNYQTMRRLGDLKNVELSKERLFEIHERVTRDTLDRSDASGRFRRRDEDVSVRDPTGSVLYHQPPPAEELEGRVAALCDFANGKTPETFIHPVLRSIIVHFWLAYDHPFVDGNGRTARALFYWSMLRQGYWLCEFISISRWILKSPARYGRAFLHTETDDNDLTYFMNYHLRILDQAIGALHEYVKRKTDELRSLEDRLKGLATLNPRQRALIGHALRHPGHRYTIQSHQTSHQVVYQTARNDLWDLHERRFLGVEKRGKTYYFTPIPELERRLAETP